MTLDFSQFHDMMHWPGTRYCRNQYGGITHHLWLAWQYRYSDYVLWIPRLVKCAFGKHTIMTGQHSAFCSVCRFKRPLTSEEQQRMDAVTASLKRLGDTLREERLKRDQVAD